MKKRSLILYGIMIILVLITLIISQNTTANSTNSTISTNETVINESYISITDFIPKEFKIGDVQFNIRVRNNKNETLTNLIALISGTGFSTYSIVPIDSLSPGEKDYILVSGNFKVSGLITLSIKINELTFYQNVTVTNPNENIEQQEKENQEILNNLSIQLEDLKEKYYALETEYYYKKDYDYDVSKASLDQLKNYLRQIESDILLEDIKGAKTNIKLASEEYLDQKRKLDNALEKSYVQKIKDYALIFSAIAGAAVTFFVLSELLKKKSSAIIGTFNSVKSTKKSKRKK